MEKENYIVVQSFMVADLHLKGNELIVYACIFGACQYENTFRGNLATLGDWTNSTKQGVINALKGLTAKGLIEKISPMEYKAIKPKERIFIPMPEDKLSNDRLKESAIIVVEKCDKAVEPNAEIAEAVNAWLNYKKERHQTYKPTGLTAFIKQQNKWCDKYGAKAVIESIERSMANNYQGVFEPKAEVKSDKYNW